MSSKTTSIILACCVALSASLAICFREIAPWIIVGAISTFGIFAVHCYMRWETEKGTLKGKK